MKSQEVIQHNESSPEFQATKSSDIPQIIDLLQGFDYPFGEDHYRWKYLQCPWDSVSIVSKIETDVIAHQGFIIRPFLINNQQILLGLSGDSLVRADRRRKGLFSQLYEVARQSASDKDVQHTWGFPNKYTLPYALKTNTKIIGWLPLYLKILHTKPVIQRLSKSSVLPHLSGVLSLFFRSRSVTPPKTIKVKEVTSYPDSLDLLWDRVLADPRRQFQNIGLRTKKYLEWRFRSCPDREYRFIVANDQEGELRGYIVLRELDIDNLRVGAIMDIFHAPFDQETSTALISYAHEYFIKTDVDMIGCVLSDTPTCIPKTLRKHGFHRFIKRFNPRPWIAAIRPYPDSPVTPSLTDSRQWYITWAENDVF